MNNITFYGERRLKLTGINKQQDVCQRLRTPQNKLNEVSNADFMATYTLLNEPTLYPSAYMVLTYKGYTKHYYAGTERVAARLGGGGLNALHHVIENDGELKAKADSLFDQCFEQVNSRVLNENDLECIMKNRFAREEFGHWIEKTPYQTKADISFDHRLFKEMAYLMVDDPVNVAEPDVYFYHSDHLGSASWITDSAGIAVQHLQYLPYGEPYINQHPYGYSERFTFTGKEKDEETGYGYFGARYMDHELMTMWLSVDPMADKYPSISPYAYCAWNPIRITDPNGDSLRLDGTAEQKQMVLDYLHRSFENLTFKCDDKGYVTLNEELSTFSTYSDKYIIDMTTNSDVSVIILLEDGEAEKRGINMQQGNPTRFGGTHDLLRDDIGNIIRVEGWQYLNINMLGRICGNDDESKKYPGIIIMHEFSEGFEGCKLARQYERPLNDKDYFMAHVKANDHFFANFIDGPNNKIKLSSPYLR